MQSPFNYRSYKVASEDGRYTAKSMDGEACTLESRYLLRVLRGVDTLWASLEQSTIPAWFGNWTNNLTAVLDLDAAAAAMDEVKLHHECRIDHQDNIPVLKFPASPLSVVRSAVATAAIMIAMKSVNIMAMMGTVAA